MARLRRPVRAGPRALRCGIAQGNTPASLRPRPWGREAGKERMARLRRCACVDLCTRQNEENMPTFDGGASGHNGRMHVITEGDPFRVHERTFLMPALITHHLFGEESIDRLPAGIVTSDEERCAFLLGNQGPDPFFFRVRTPHMRDCMQLAKVMHRSRMSKQFACLRDGVSHLQKHDAQLGRAFTLGLLSHYVLDRNAHPFVYEQQFGVLDADPDLESAASQVHAVIESDLDVLMLQLKRGGATTADYPPVSELVTSDRIDKVGGALMSHVARSVYGLDVGVAEYGGAVADMQMLYRIIEPAGSLKTDVIGKLEGLVSDYSLLASLAHPVTDEQPVRAGNMEHIAWKNPFTEAVSHESFPEVFNRALCDYERAAACFIECADMEQMTGHVNYSGRPLAADEEFDREE